MKGKFIPFTVKQEQKIKDEFLLKPVKRLADELNCSYGRIMRFLKKNGLVIPRELIEKRIQDSRKKKGSVPFNKGLKQSSYMTKESIEKTKTTRFKKGNMPINHRVVGSERITKDGYIEIKLKEPNKWDLKHRVIWRKTNPEPKEDETIYFKDGNKLNITIENLGIKSRIRNMLENSHANYPKEIIPTKELIIKINKAI